MEKLWNAYVAELYALDGLWAMLRARGGEAFAETVEAALMVKTERFFSNRYQMTVAEVRNKARCDFDYTQMEERFLVVSDALQPLDFLSAYVSDKRYHDEIQCAFCGVSKLGDDFSRILKCMSDVFIEAFGWEEATMIDEVADDGVAVFYAETGEKTYLNLSDLRDFLKAKRKKWQLT